MVSSAHAGGEQRWASTGSDEASQPANFVAASQRRREASRHFEATSGRLLGLFSAGCGLWHPFGVRRRPSLPGASLEDSLAPGCGLVALRALCGCPCVMRCGGSGCMVIRPPSRAVRITGTLPAATKRRSRQRSLLLRSGGGASGHSETTTGRLLGLLVVGLLLSCTGGTPVPPEKGRGQRQGCRCYGLTSPRP